MDYLPVSKMKEGYLYYIDARNASYGIWFASEQGFVIRRVKFDDVFIFTEIHYDLSKDFGTAKPFLELEESPFVAKDIESVAKGNFWRVPKEDAIIKYLEERTKHWESPY